MHGNCFIEYWCFLLFSNYQTLTHLSSYSLVNRIVRTINLFQRSKNGFVIYRLSLWVTAVHTIQSCASTLIIELFDGCRKLKTRGSPVVYLEYMDGGYSLLGIFRRDRWYSMSICTELSVLSKIICPADLLVC